MSFRAVVPPKVAICYIGCLVWHSAGIYLLTGPLRRLWAEA
jgi:hypothetical protein